jgi:hypothetical protein
MEKHILEFVDCGLKRPNGFVRIDEEKEKLRQANMHCGWGSGPLFLCFGW